MTFSFVYRVNVHIQVLNNNYNSAIVIADDCRTLQFLKTRCAVKSKKSVAESSFHFVNYQTLKPLSLGRGLLL